MLLYIPAGQSQSLPIEMQADQHLLEAQEAYREGKHRQAVEAFRRIESLNVSIPSEFHFFYGSSLAETGHHTDALVQLSEYLNQEGRNGRHYQNALRLYGEMEQAESQRKALQLTYGGSKTDAATAIVPAPGGGYLVAGHTGSKGAGGSDMWIVKTDEQGRKQWDRTYGGPKGDRANAIVAAPGGGYLVAGSTSSKGAGGSDMWIVKLNEQGRKQWDRTYGNSEDDYAYAMVPAPGGGYVVAGTTYPRGPRGHWTHMWIVKLDEQGHKQWERTHGGDRGGSTDAIAPAPGGGYVVAGAKHSGGDPDRWILKIDEQGHKQWDRTYKGEWFWDSASAIVAAPGGGYVVAGKTRSKSGGDEDMWIAKLDDQGREQWYRTHGGSKDDQAYAIAPAPGGGYLVAGYTRSKGAGEGDIWIVKLDDQGRMQWDRTYGGSKDDLADAIAPAPGGGYLVAGSTRSQGAGGDDMWIIKLDEQGQFE